MTPLEEELIEDEGLRLKLYRCTAGKLTIGVGRNIEDRGLTKDEAMFLFRNDIDLSRKELSYHLPWFESLDPVRQDVLINMHFNMGWKNARGGGLSTFVNTLKAVQEGRYDDAAEGMRKSKWAKQVQESRSSRLIKQMKTGTR